MKQRCGTISFLCCFVLLFVSRLSTAIEEEDFDSNDVQDPKCYQAVLERSGDKDLAAAACITTSDSGQVPKKSPWGRRGGRSRGGGSRRRSSRWGSSRRRFSSSRRRFSSRRRWSSRRRAVSRRRWVSRRRAVSRRRWVSRRRAVSRRRWVSRRRAVSRRRWVSRIRAVSRRRWVSRRRIISRRRVNRRRVTRRRVTRRRVTRRRVTRRRVTRRRVTRRRVTRRRMTRRRVTRRRVTRRRVTRRRVTRRRISRRRISRRRISRRRISRRRISRRRISRRRISRRRISKTRKRTAYLKVKKGQVTFDSEGNNNKKSKYYSRKAHVPSKWSGVTLGRGYDMKHKSQKQVISDLTKAGMSKSLATKFAKGAGLSGKKATDFLKKNNLQNVQITGQQQKSLFKISYGRQEKETKRLVTKYYKSSWSSINQKIQQVLTDMKYRGDLLPRSNSAGQKALKAAVKANNLKEVEKVMSNKKYWKNVPADRFQRRIDFLKSNNNSG